MFQSRWTLISVTVNNLESMDDQLVKSYLYVYVFGMHSSLMSLRGVALSGISSAPHRWPWQRQRHAESEDRRALRLWVCLRGGAAEKEDDSQCHQQQEMEPDCKDYHKWGAGPAGMRREGGCVSTNTDKKWKMKLVKIEWLMSLIVLVCVIGGRPCQFRAERERGIPLSSAGMWNRIFITCCYSVTEPQ